MDKTFDDLKLGDRVWIDSEVMFFSGYDAVDKEHIFLANKDNRVLERVNVNAEHISFTEPLPRLKEGQPIWVRSSDISGWVPRFFIAFVDNECRASAAPNNWNASSNERRAWSRWKLPTSRELVDAGIDPEVWESRD